MPQLRVLGVRLTEDTGPALAKPLYQANIKVVQTQDGMLGSLLDLKR